MYLLIDCNNFFASCEQVFNPKLRNKPLVVLSNNDGCVVARSQEARALGIPMGAPAFKHKTLFETKGVISLSSNFRLYGDMSARVMSILESFEFDLEIYSIDEAFIHIDAPSNEYDFYTLGKTIRAQIKQWVGISTSVGIGTTKTLAKVANKIAKKGANVFVIESERDRVRALEKFPINDVWGIGNRHTEKLQTFGLKYAYELTQKSDDWIRKQMSVMGLRTVLELRGESCLKLEEYEPQKTIVRSRSFGIEIDSKEKLIEAASSFASQVARKLRKHNQVSSSITFFASSNRFAKTPYYSASAHINLGEATSYTPTIIEAAIQAADRVYKDGVSFKRAGVMSHELSSENSVQKDLFSGKKSGNSKRKKLMGVFDSINKTLGAKSIYYASDGLQPKWESKRENKSKNYTLSWSELPTISLDE